LDNGRWLKETLLLHALSRFGPLGRKTIARILKLPEGVTRGMVDRLRREGYLQIGRLGAELTSKGVEELCRRLAWMRLRALKRFPGERLGVGPIAVAAHVECMADKVTLGLEERDQAVRAGALGAVTITYKDGIYSIPGVYRNLKTDAYDLYEVVSGMFKLNDGDCILVVFGEDYWTTVEAIFTIASRAWETA